MLYPKMTRVTRRIKYKTIILAMLVDYDMGEIYGQI